MMALSQLCFSTEPRGNFGLALIVSPKEFPGDGFSKLSVNLADISEGLSLRLGTLYHFIEAV